VHGDAILTTREMLQIALVAGGMILVHWSLRDSRQGQIEEVIKSGWLESKREPLRSAKHVAQFVFGPFQDTLLLLGKRFACAIDVEVQHRHG
jgi:hypothetical protein